MNTSTPSLAQQSETAKRNPSTSLFLKTAVDSIWVLSSSDEALGLIAYSIYGGTQLATNKSIWNGSIRNKMRLSISISISRGSDRIQHSSNSEKSTAFRSGRAGTTEKTRGSTIGKAHGTLWSIWRGVSGGEIAGGRCTTFGS